MSTHFPRAVQLIALWLLCLIARAHGQAPANDKFADRAILSDPLPVSKKDNLTGATSEAGEPNIPSVWYSWTADRSGRMYAYCATTTSSGYPAIDGNFNVSVYESTLPDPELILDNTEAMGVSISGSWTPTAAIKGFYGANYFHDGNSGKGSKSIRFTPAVAEAGYYDVYLWWPADSNRATHVPVDVIHSGGTSTYHVNQRTAGGAWVQVNTGRPLMFEAGNSGSVLIRTNGTSDGYVVADAVRLVPSPLLPDLHFLAGIVDEAAYFNAIAGRTYQIAVRSTSGSFDLRLGADRAMTSPQWAYAKPGQPFHYQITTNFQAFGFELEWANLPDGLTLDFATGLISGTPAAGTSGTYAFSVATHKSPYPYDYVHSRLTLFVGPAPSVITSPSSAYAIEGYGFHYQITATQNPVTFSATDLPTGLHFDSATGIISGIPTESGDFSISLQANNSSGAGPSVGWASTSFPGGPPLPVKRSTPPRASLSATKSSPPITPPATRQPTCRRVSPWMPRQA